MVLHLLERDRRGGENLAEALNNAMDRVGHCSYCRNFTEEVLCGICIDRKRDSTVICIVETPADVAAIEQSSSYKGKYFVLMGHLSPIDGIGPEDIGLDMLEQQLLNSEVKEVILATNPTVEGEATAYYLAEMLANIAVSYTHLRAHET